MPSAAIAAAGAREELPAGQAELPIDVGAPCSLVRPLDRRGASSPSRGNRAAPRNASGQFPAAAAALSAASLVSMPGRCARSRRSSRLGVDYTGHRAPPLRACHRSTTAAGFRARADLLGCGKHLVVGRQNMQSRAYSRKAACHANADAAAGARYQYDLVLDSWKGHDVCTPYHDAPSPRLWRYV